MNIEKLKSIMEQQNLTMYRLSKLSGVPESVINRLIWGQAKDPHISTVKKIADALGVKIDDLL